MQRHNKRSQMAIGLVFAASTLAACADKPADLTFNPMDASLRQDLGAVAVVPVSCETTYGVPTPAQGAGAGAKAGAGQGALAGAAPGAGFCYIGGEFGCLVVGFPMMAAGGLVGAIAGSFTGAAKAHSAEEVIAAETVLRDIMTSTPADERLAELIVAEAGQTGVPERVERAEKGTAAADLANNGFASVLQVTVPVFALYNRTGEIDPDVSLVIGAQASIAKTGASGGGDAWSRSWVYRSKEESFFELAANNGNRLREAIATGLATVAAKVTADVFVSTSPESYPDPERFFDLPPGVVRPGSCHLQTPKHD